MNIVLIGLMGSGKTTLGRLLAEKTGFAFIDTDELIETSEGRSIKDIFDTDGEAAFRQLETKYLNQLSELSDCVISTGGGIVLSEENRKSLLDLGRVYWLNPTLEALSERLKSDKSRPLLQNQNITEILTDLLHKREALYRACADSIIDTSDATKIESIAHKIQKDFEAKS
jgi:shikimate kinase